MRTPSAVRSAFAPEMEHELTLEAVLVLEAMGCRYLTGGNPGMRDAILCYLAITDLDGLKEARRKGIVDEALAAWSQGRRPAEVLELQPLITDAVTAAFAPAAGSAAAEEDLEPLDRLQKKTPAAAAGG